MEDIMRSRRAVLLAATLCAFTPVKVAQAEDAADSAQVTIDNFAFTPAEITVRPGTTLVWLNRDDIPHTVTDAARPAAYKSPPLDTGETFSHVFETPGVYRYFCSLHAHMQGTVVVK
jgi:plastocyanin